MNKIDARGMSCPQPVLLVKNTLKGGTPPVEILVDNQTAKNNILRFLKSAGYSQVTTKEQGEDIVVQGKK